MSLEPPKYKILLVDDDPKFHKEFISALSNIFDIDVAYNQETAEQKAASKRYELFALDLHLKTSIDETTEPDGFELINVFARKYPKCPIVVVTNEYRESVFQSLHIKGVIDCWKKPEVSLEQIASSIKFRIQSKIAQQTFTVFLSHSKKDKALVNALSNKLKQKVIKNWLDEKELKIGDILPLEIQDAISNSKYFLLIHSFNSKQSLWVKKEIEYALKENPLKIKIIKYDFSEIPKQLNSDDQLYLDLTAFKPKLVEAYFESNNNQKKAFKKVDQYFNEKFEELLQSIT